MNNGEHADKNRSGRAGSSKTRLPPVYKKRGGQALAAYLALIVVTGLWLYLRSDQTLNDWNARTPQAIISLSGQQGTGDTSFVQPDIATPDGPALPSGDMAYISIIITDAGLINDQTQRALRTLPPAVGIAFSPYSPDIGEWLRQARATSHETFLLLPMEPLTYPKDDPGPQALLSRKSEAQNKATLRALLALGNTDGVMNFMGSRFLSDGRNMSMLFESIKQRGQFFVENPAMSGLQSAASFAADTGASYLSADLQIDVQASPAAIRQQLYLLEKTAQAKGHAIGIASPYPITLDILPQWAESLARRGFELIPPSKMLQQKQTSFTTGTP